VINAISPPWLALQQGGKSLGKNVGFPAKLVSKKKASYASLKM